MICENIYGIRVSVRSDNVIFQGNDGIGCFYSRVSVHQIRRGPRIWVWLGPLLGFIGAVAIIFAFSYFCFFRQASLEPSINEGNVRFSQSSTQNSRLLQSWIPKSTKQPETQQPSQLQRLSENWPAAQRNSPNYTSTAGSAQHSMARKEPEVIPEVEDEIQPAAQVASQTEGKTNDNDTGDSQANVEKNGTAEKGPEGTLEVEDENQPAAQGRCIIQ